VLAPAQGHHLPQELGANKIALGHHRDDIVQTLLLNMFFGAKLKAMPPKLATDKGEFIVIRPLAYCAEKDIAAYARRMEFPIIPCDLCGSQENLQRQNIKAMLHAWEHEFPGRTEKIFRALTNVAPSHLADTDLFDFKSLSSKASEEDPLFGAMDQNAALSFAGTEGNRIEFVRKAA
jgi:tRNA 2-thiocytidine biosynthesis protein TtcA